MENTTQPQPITVQDLDGLRAVVDLAATRGAFRGAELEQVGALFNKLNAFLDSIVAQARLDQEAAGTTPEAPKGE